MHFSGHKDSNFLLLLQVLVFEVVLEEVGELVVLEAPAGGDEEVCGGLGHEAFDGDVGAEAADYAGAEGGVAFGGELDDVGGWILRHRGAVEYLELVEFDGGHREGVEAVDGGHYHGFIFAGEAEDEVESHGYAADGDAAHGILGGCPGAAAVYAFEGAVVGGFGTQFDEYLFARSVAEGCDGVQQGVGNAVGTCSDD